jgi:hypothetical protein
MQNKRCLKWGTHRGDRYGEDLEAEGCGRTLYYWRDRWCVLRHRSRRVPLLCHRGGGVPDLPPPQPPAELPGLLNESLIFLLVWGILGIIAVVMAVVGGVCALRRRIWRLALAGSISTLIGPWGLLGILIPPIMPVMLPFTIPGILATVFIVRGRWEFK